MKTFREFLSKDSHSDETVLDESIKTSSDFMKVLNDLIFNLKKHGPRWKSAVSGLEDFSYSLEKDIEDKKALSKLSDLISRLPNDPDVLNLADILDNYIENV